MVMIQDRQDLFMQPGSRFQAPRMPIQMGGMPPLPATLGQQQLPTPVGQSPVAQTPAPTQAPAASPATPAAPAPNALSPADALNNFANSAGMNFAMQQMANGVNNLYAAHGAVQSGAAAKELQDRAGQIALQNYFFPYMNYLTGQQAMGAQAASAINGVGSSYGNTLAGMGQNTANAIGGINQNSANAIGQGAINVGNAQANNAAIGGLANANLYNTIGSSLGSIGSSFIKPSY